MKRKLLAVALALALVGMAGGAVTAQDAGGATVADYDVSNDISIDNDEPFDDGGGTCSISPANDEPFDDGGGGC